MFSDGSCMVENPSPMLNQYLMMDFSGGVVSESGWVAGSSKVGLGPVQAIAQPAQSPRKGLGGLMSNSYGLKLGWAFTSLS